MGFDFLDFGFPKSGTDWKSINGKPYITVSSKGRSNGLSTKINDGADFGPDTTLNATSPNQTGAPYSPYIGIEEAIKYAIANNIGEIRLSAGLFDISNAPFTTDPLTGRKYKLYIPIVNESTTGEGNNPISLKIVGASKIVPTAYWTNIPTSGFRNTTTVYDGSVDTTTTSTVQDFMFGVMSTPSTAANPPFNFIALYIDGIVFQVQGETASYLGGVDTSYAMLSSFGKIRIGMIQGQALVHQSATGMMWVMDGGSLAGKTAEQIDIYGFQDGLISSFGQVYIGYIHVSWCQYAISNYGNYGQAQVYSGFVGIAEFEYCAVGLNLNTGPLASGESKISVVFGSFGSGDLFGPTGQIPYQYSIVAPSAQTYGNAITILAYELGSSGITPVFSIPNNTDTVRILTWEHFGTSSYGFSPTPTTPSVPASGTAIQNTNPYAVNIYLYGGTVTEIQITKNGIGTAQTVFSSATGIALSGQVYKLNPSDTITITYTAAPTWEWLSD